MEDGYYYQGQIEKYSRKPDGYGIMFMKEGDIYEGLFKKGIPNGECRWYYHKNLFEGDFEGFFPNFNKTYTISNLYNNDIFVGKANIFNSMIVGKLYSSSSKDDYEFGQFNFNMERDGIIYSPKDQSLKLYDRGIFKKDDIEFNELEKKIKKFKDSYLSEFKEIINHDKKLIQKKQQILSDQNDNSPLIDIETYIKMQEYKNWIEYNKTYE